MSKMQVQYKENDLVSITLRFQGRAIGDIHFQYGNRPTKEKFADMVREVVKSDSLASIQPCECVGYLVDEAWEEIQKL